MPLVDYKMPKDLPITILHVPNIHNAIFDKVNKSQKLHQLIINLLFFYDNINSDVVKSILKIFDENRYIYSIDCHEINAMLVKKFVDIDILISTIKLLSKTQKLKDNSRIGICVCNYMSNAILYNIDNYTTEIINNKVDELKKNNK